MTLAAKYGFAFIPVPGGWENPIVRAFATDWFQRMGYPTATVSKSTSWLAVAEPDSSEVYCVFGWRVNNEFQAIEVGDFYARPTRRGVLASYAALERIKADCDRLGNVVYTLTPLWNTKMLKALKHFFPAPELGVTVYRPKSAVLDNPSPHERIAMEHLERMREEVAS